MSEAIETSAEAGVDLLEAHEIVVHFEGLAAIDGVSLSMNSSEVLGLIGPNGAGKTTLVNVLTGFQKPSHGTVLLRGVDVTGWPASAVYVAVAVRPEPVISTEPSVGGVSTANVRLAALACV